MKEPRCDKCEYRAAILEDCGCVCRKKYLIDGIGKWIDYDSFKSGTSPKWCPLKRSKTDD
jgi:hypothetical protein